jgi:hypothetical protein
VFDEASSHPSSSPPLQEEAIEYHGDTDDLLTLEETAYRIGKCDAIAAAEADGIFQEGYQAGVLRGLAIGLEVGFDAAMLHRIQQQHQDTVTTSSRQIKRWETLAAKISAVPLLNDETVDFEASVREIRSLSRLVCAGVEGLEPFRPPAAFAGTMASSDW